MLWDAAFRSFQSGTGRIGGNDISAVVSGVHPCPRAVIVDIVSGDAIAGAVRVVVGGCVG